MKISKITCVLIDQMIEVISQMAAEEYAQSLDLFNGSTIGKHFRHIHDFYDCVICPELNGEIDYCKRKRNTELECNPQAMINQFNNVKSMIFELSTEEKVLVHGDFQYDDGSRATAVSSIGRELLYAYDHAVHHLAIIKLGLRAQFEHINYSSDMGVASSTLRYQHTNS